jgi:hypothetical protein
MKPSPIRTAPASGPAPVIGLAAAIGLALAAAAPAQADVIDTTMPRTVAVGAPRGAAPSERLDPRRTGRARTALPTRAVEVWRRHVNGNLEVPPVVDEAGDVIVALGISEIVKLGSDAREKWRARLVAGAAASPVILADGTIVVLTAAGVAQGFTPGGAPRFTTPLGIARRDTDTIPLALSSGGLLVAAGSTVVELDADGVVRARATIEDRLPGAGAPTLERAAGAIVEGPMGALITTVNGGVFRFRPPAAPRKLGSLGGIPTRGAMLADDRTLVAVVDQRRVVALDLPSGTTQTRSSGILFDAPPALGPGGLVMVATQLGQLLGLDAAGNEKVRVMLDKPLPASALTGTTFLPPELKPSPPVIVDPHGRVAFLRANGRAGMVAPSGKIEVLSERVCATPVAVLPAGEKRMLVACRDGGLWMYGE